MVNKSTTTLSLSIVETYSRLLVYSEIEYLGIKWFLNQLQPKVFVQQSWGTLHTLLKIEDILKQTLPQEERGGGVALREGHEQ